MVYEGIDDIRVLVDITNIEAQKAQMTETREGFC